VIEGGGTFGLFGTSIFVTGIYCAIIGILLFICPDVVTELWQIVLFVVRQFKFVIVLLAGYVVISILLSLLHADVLFVIQLPIFPVLLINAAFQSALPGIIRLVLSLVIGVPVSAYLWYVLITRGVRRLRDGLVQSKRLVLDQGDTNGDNASVVLQARTYSRYFILLLAITFLLRFLPYLVNVPGYDTPSYLRLAIDYMESGSMSGVLAHESFYSIFPVFLLSCFSGFNPSNVLLGASIYSPLVGVVTNLFFMLTIKRGMRNDRFSLYGGVFYALSPMIIFYTFGTFKQDFAVMMLFAGLYLYLRQSRSPNKVIRALSISLAGALIIISFLYQFFIMFLIFAILFFLFMFKKSKKIILMLVGFYALAFIAVIVAFTWFKDFVVFQPIYSFVYWELYLQVISPVPLYSNEFLFPFGTIVVYVPFVLFGVVYYWRGGGGRRGGKLLRGVLTLLFLMMFFSFFPVFGAFPNFWRILVISEYALIFVSACGVDEMHGYLKRLAVRFNHYGTGRDVVGYILHQRKALLALVVGYLSVSYVLNFSSYSGGSITAGERAGLVFLRDHVDMSEFTNDNITDSVILAPRSMLYWIYFYFSYSATSYPRDLEGLAVYYVEDSTTGQVHEIRRDIEWMCTIIEEMFTNNLYLINTGGYSSNINEILVSLPSHNLNQTVIFNNGSFTIYRIYHR
jgi:hypothetical protein